ncbi:MAG: hypothetical protein AAGG38_14770 [Planctomycetota bacterium]
MQLIAQGYGIGFQGMYDFLLNCQSLEYETFFPDITTSKKISLFESEKLIHDTIYSSMDMDASFETLELAAKSISEIEPENGAENVVGLDVMLEQSPEARDLVNKYLEMFRGDLKNGNSEIIFSNPIELYLFKTFLPCWMMYYETLKMTAFGV